MVHSCKLALSQVLLPLVDNIIVYIIIIYRGPVVQFKISNSQLDFRRSPSCISDAQFHS